MRERESYPAVSYKDIDELGIYPDGDTCGVIAFHGKRASATLIPEFEPWETTGKKVPFRAYHPPREIVDSWIAAHPGTPQIKIRGQKPQT